MGPPRAPAGCQGELGQPRTWLIREQVGEDAAPLLPLQPRRPGQPSPRHRSRRCGSIHTAAQKQLSSR